MDTHTNTNHAHRFYIVPTKRDKRHTLYSVVFNGRVLILGTHLPSAHGCRHLASLGLTGRAEMWDFERSYPRMVFPDLVKAGGMTVKESGNRRPEVKLDRNHGQLPIQRLPTLGRIITRADKSASLWALVQPAQLERETIMTGATTAAAVPHVNAILLPLMKDNRPRYRLELGGEVLNRMTSLPGSTACDVLARRGYVGWVEISFPNEDKPSIRRWSGDVRLKPSD